MVWPHPPRPRIAAHSVDGAATPHALPGIKAPWDTRAAVSAHLRQEWRQRVDLLGWWQASVEHDYLGHIPDDIGSDLAAVVADLRILAPESEDTASADWPGGWVLRRGGDDITGPGSRAAWRTETEAHAARAALGDKGSAPGGGGPIDVVWAPFARATSTRAIVLDDHHWTTRDGGTELGA